MGCLQHIPPLTAWGAVCKRAIQSQRRWMMPRKVVSRHNRAVHTWTQRFWQHSQDLDMLKSVKNTGTWEWGGHDSSVLVEEVLAFYDCLERASMVFFNRITPLTTLQGRPHIQEDLGSRKWTWWVSFLGWGWWKETENMMLGGQEGEGGPGRSWEKGDYAGNSLCEIPKH